MSASIYKPLDRDRREIRLLHLDWNGDDDEIVTCRMTTASLEEGPSYAALSYVWGTQPPTEEILVNEKEVLITKSLLRALWHLRRNELFREIPLWADAICIDQNNLAERGHQVKLMASVFSGAFYVIAWLGEPTGGPDDINFDLVREIAAHRAKKGFPVDREEDSPLTDEDFEWMTRDPKYYAIDAGHSSGNVYWNGAINISRSNYWTRTWIFQELVLASCADRHIFFYGTESITYGLLETYNDFIKRIEWVLPSKPRVVPSSLWRYILFEKSYTFLLILVRLTRLSKNVRDYTPAYISGICFSKDPRDAIYGLLGITAMDIIPDYERPVADVYRDWFGVCLRRSTYRGLLHWAGIGYGPSIIKNLPSWVPNLAINEKQQDWSISEPIVSWDKKIHMEPPKIIDSNTLRICGILLDSVSKVDHPCLTCDSSKPDLTFWRFCIDHIATCFGKGERRPDRMLPLQEILAVVCYGVYTSRSQKISFPLEYTHPLARSFRDLLARGGSVDDRNASIEKLGLSSTDDIPEALDCKLHSPKDMATGKLLMADGVLGTDEGIKSPDPLYFMDRCRQNAFFCTKGGYLGKGPPGTLPGDRVYLVDGLYAPGLLRRLDDSTWAFVGTCYVEGLITQELLQMTEDGKLPIEEIHMQ
ncbi:heterokaryon incompatibility protein-domain-containing protein [Hypoxylon rubiginosum]|uniref:Heterokaryon incompatibility protein-domain-containing protein n=1 Tax=Hypoxylon rubiginosum TaxID=110542 RepID=A0ACC0CUC5_9PEZI|nr:heterokaryon incompatibility protein-domain-containing protein [Hypoxylon rubiginosum]